MVRATSCWENLKLDFYRELLYLGVLYLNVSPIKLYFLTCCKAEDRFLTDLNGGY